MCKLVDESQDIQTLQATTFDPVAAVHTVGFHSRLNDYNQCRLEETQEILWLPLRCQRRQALPSLSKHP